jgi:hypothetical protein
MSQQRDEARQPSSPTGAGQTTGAGILQQSAAPGDNAQFGANPGDGQPQQEQRSTGDGRARPPRETLKETANALRRDGSAVTRAATQQIEDIAKDQKSRASGYVQTLALAVHASAETLDGDGFGASASAVHRVAEDIGQFAETLKSRDPRQLVEDVHAFARNNPAMFLGASLFAGFGVARFLKSGVTDATSNEPSGTARRTP